MVNRRKKDKQKVTIVMPAYNAAKTLEATHREIPTGSYEEIILVDDGSGDETVKIAKKLNLIVIQHEKNKGYGANQKTCYDLALKRGADVIVMLHPDYQYDPRIIPNITLPILQGQADVVLASRFLRDPLKGGPIKGGMPLYKYVANRVLTSIENLALGTYFSEFHTGYRAFSRKALKSINYHLNSDNFIFDNEILVQLIQKRTRFKVIPVETKYFTEASSVGFIRGVRYGFGVLKTIGKYLLHKYNLVRLKQFS